MRQCCRIFERQPDRDRQERALGRAHVLGEAARAEREHVAEHSIADLEARHAGPNRLDLTGRVQADPRLARRAQADEQAHELWPRRQPVEVCAVDRCRADAHEDLVVDRLRLVDLAQLDDVGRSVALAQCGLHRSSPLGDAAIGLLALADGNPASRRSATGAGPTAGRPVPGWLGAASEQILVAGTDGP